MRLLAFSASLAMLACGAAVSAPSPTVSGQPVFNVTGTLDRATAPICPTDEPCDPPAVSKVVFSGPGRPEVSARLEPDGSFALHLDPGGYTVTTAPPPLGGAVMPSEVRVPATGRVELHLRIVRTPA
jgi:hypothetical protein